MTHSCPTRRSSDLVGAHATPPQPYPAFAGEGATERADAIDISPAVVGEYTRADGRKAVPVFQLIAERYLDPQYAPEAVSEQCGIPTDTIARIARELAQAAFDSKLTLPIAWTDAWGREHAEMVGRPVSMHAMRGHSAHSNGRSEEQKPEHQSLMRNP